MEGVGQKVDNHNEFFCFTGLKGVNSLFSSNHSMQIEQAVYLSENFGVFISEAQNKLANAEDQLMVMGYVNEILSFFNGAMALLPSLCVFANDIIDLVCAFLGGGGDNYLASWESYSIEFSYPPSIAIAYTYPSRT